MSSKNAYSYFVDDYVARKRKEGIIVPEKEKFQLAGPAWAKLSPKQKEVYQVKSKGGPREKFNSHGIPMEFIRNLQVERELALNNENAEVEETLKTAQESNTLLKKTFYIVDTNFYCILNDGQHVTCEVAVVCFNLERGVRTNNYHCFIDVGSIPTGYGLNAKQNVKENGCPLPPVPGAEGDMLRILAELISFVDPAVNPIYTLPKKTLQVESFFKQLYLCAGNSNEFKIYCLARLFHKLRNVFTSSEDIGFPSQAIALAQLEKDPFTYTKGLGCQIHEEGDQFYCCALSVAKRWAFVICDFCCKPAGVSLKPGFHVPQKSYTGDFEVVQAAAARQQISRASSSKAQEKIDYHYQEPVPFLNEAAIASPSYVAPVWDRPQTAARAPPTPPVEASSPEEQWPSLGGGGLGGNPRKNKRGGRR